MRTANIDNSFLRQDLPARPGQEVLKRQAKGPLGSHSQTSLHPLGSFREFPGLAPSSCCGAEGSEFPLCSPDDTWGTCGSKGGGIYGGGEISVSKSIRLGYREDS